MRRLVVYSAVIALGLGALVSAQATQATAPAPGQPATQQTPARTRPGRPGDPVPKGTAIIRGTVVEAATGQPLRKASVSARSMDQNGGAGITMTDAQGKFEIKELPAGRYSLTAAKGVYVTMQYGARRPGDQGTPIEMLDGQVAEKVNFSLIRGAVIAGRIVDDAGEPLPGVNVSAQRYVFMAGSRRLQSSGAGGNRTDDTGAYRLYGLPPGDYYVNASGGFNAMTIVVNGTAMNGDADAFAPTYYPGTTNIAEAQRVTVKAGQELTGVHFMLTATKLSKVRGRVLNSSGEPARGMIMIVPADIFGGISFGPNSNAQIAGDGSFQLNNVAPGRYTLNVRPIGMPGPDQESAEMAITVGNDDIDNVMLVTSVGATARGIIQTDDGSPPPFRFDEVRIGASPIDPTSMSFGNAPPKINPDFTFELTSLFDRRRVNGGIITPSALWSLKGVYYDGADVTDSGIDFSAGKSYEGVQVVFTQKVTDLSGLVTDSRGRAVTDATVVIFPANREKWTAPRFIRTSRPDTDGRYNFKGLPPYDDYMIIAVQYLESGQGADPEFLTRAREEAKSLGLAEGEKKAFDVKLSSLVP